MAKYEWFLRTTAPLVTAASAANLNQSQNEQMRGLAWLTAQHKRLMTLSQDAATAEYQKLDKKTQDALGSLFGNESYTPQDNSLFGNAKRYIGGAFSEISKDLTGFSDALSRPIIAMTLHNDTTSWSQAWSDAADGKRVFDESRASIVDKSYKPEVAKIARRIAMGDTVGQILADSKTDAEFSAVESLLQGDQTILNAIRDYDQSKISFGRNLAHLFGLNPAAGSKDQGFGGTMFNIVSGVGDAAFDILADPTTYIFAPISAANKAKYGILQLMRAEQAVNGIGEFSRMQKLLGASKGKIGWDVAFQNKNIVSTFDQVGKYVQEAKTAKTAAERALARNNIAQVNRSFDDNFADQMIKNDITSAEKARVWLKDTGNAELVVSGRSGTSEMVLPYGSKNKAINNGVRSFVQHVTGYKKATAEAEQFAKSGAADNYLLGLAPIEAVKMHNLQHVGQRIVRVFDRALTEHSIYTGGEKMDKSMHIKSVGTVYTLARAIYDKPTAKMIANMFAGAAAEGERRQLVKGLYLSLGDALGATSTEVGARQFEDKIVNPLTNYLFSEEMYVNEALSKITGLPVGSKYIPAKHGDRQLAVAMNHVDHQITIPSIIDIKKIVQLNGISTEGMQGVRKGYQSAANKVILSSVKPRSWNQAATDWWSAMNLLPRLGLRSVLDEALFSSLTMPVKVAQNAIRGWQAGVTQRIVAKPSGVKDTGIVVQHILRHILTTDINGTKLMAAARDDEVAAKLLEEQLTKSILGRVTFAGKRGAIHAKYVADHVENGSIKQLQSFSQGAAKALATAEVGAGEEVAKLVDISENLNKAMRASRVKLGGAPTIISKTNSSNTEYKLNYWIQLMNRVDRNGMIGKLSVKYMEDPEKAVAAISKYLQKNPDIFNMFERSATSTHDQMATSMYAHVRGVFVDDFGKLNEPLLAKVRTKGTTGKIKVSAAKLTESDIDEAMNGVASQMFGYRKQVEVYERAGDHIGALMDTLFAVSDRQIATLSREPAFYSYLFHYREQFANAEKAFENNLLANGWKPKAARDATMKRYDNLAGEMALNRVIGFIDNPHIRSNLAMNGRNLARYYRANEDFYRRALRAASPTSIIRLRLAANGLQSAGFIHKDENGNQYFTIPFDQIMYAALQPTLSKVFGLQMQRPMPMSLTGQIKMLTPSLDPNSNVPQLASPLMSIEWNMFRNILPAEYRDGVQRLLFGQYSTSNKTLWDSIQPSGMKRVSAMIAAVGDDQNNQEIANATMNSMAFYAATGNAPRDDATPSEIDQYKYDVSATARSIVFLKNMLGLLSPVSPQYAETNDVPKELLKVGGVSLKADFHQLVAAEIESGDPNAWNNAIAKWTKMNPGRLVYTVPETVVNTVAPIRSTKEAITWIQQNPTLTKNFREASVFLMPQVNNFDMDAYSFLKREGYISSKSVDQYFSDIQNIAARNQYYAMRDNYTARIAAATTESEAQQIAFERDQMMNKFKESKPNLVAQMEQQDGNTQLNKNIVADMKRMLNSGMVPNSSTVDKLRKLVDDFEQSYGSLQSIDFSTDAAAMSKELIKKNALERLQRIAAGDPNAYAFYNNVLKGLLS